MEPVTVYRQDRIKEKFERDVEQERLAPSIILHGLPGLGKERMAFYLAERILCEEGGAEACGECLSCRKVTRLLHPDVQWIFPKPGSVKDAELEKIVRRKSEGEFFRPTFEKTSSHAIDDIRQLRSISGKCPYEGRYKVFIVTEADRMTVEAANAFLKLLEEPPDDTVIVMTTSRLYALLPTIRSRCEEIRFSPLPMSALREALIGILDIPFDQADQLSRSSEGSLGRAVWMYREGGKDGFDDAWQLLQLARDGSESDRLEYIVKGSLKGDRERIRAALDVLASLLRDLIACSLDLRKDQLINVSRSDLLESKGDVPIAGIIRSMKRVDELRNLLDRNINTSILLWQLLHSLASQIRSVHP